MNILVVGKFYTEGFALHIAETLAVMGHKVQRFEPGIRSGRIGGAFGQRLDQVLGVFHSATDNMPSIRARRTRALWETVDKQPLDVVLVCHDFLWPHEVAELKRRTGSCVVMWFPDSMINFGRAFFMNAPYDALFFKDPYIVHSFADVLESPVYYLPEGFNPHRHWLPEEAVGRDVAYECDVATVGNQHSWRIAFYKNLTDVNVKLWGNRPPLWLARGPVARMDQGHGVYNHEKVRAFRGAKIVLNNLHCSEIWGVNVRTFEAAGAGAFQMLDWRPGLGQLFDDGKELISFRSVADLKKKIVYWLPREEQRRITAQAGMRRAHAEHTYALRLRLLLETVGGSQHGYPTPDIRYVMKGEIAA